MLETLSEPVHTPGKDSDALTWLAHHQLSLALMLRFGFSFGVVLLFSAISVVTVCRVLGPRPISAASNTLVERAALPAWSEHSLSLASWFREW